MSPEKIWSKVLEELKPQLSSANYRGWLAQAEALNLENDVLVLAVPSAFVESQLKLRYLDLISKSLEKIVGKNIKIEFKIDPSKFSKNKVVEDEASFDLMPQSQPSSLNPRFNMENFVVGPSNNVAYAAAQAVVQSPGLAYNPLLIYGGTGVGKTHLMLAVGNAIVSKSP